MTKETQNHFPEAVGNPEGKNVYSLLYSVTLEFEGHLLIQANTQSEADELASNILIKEKSLRQIFNESTVTNGLFPWNIELKEHELVGGTDLDTSKLSLVS